MWGSGFFQTLELRIARIPIPEGPAHDPESNIALSHRDGRSDASGVVVASHAMRQSGKSFTTSSVAVMIPVSPLAI